MNSSTVKMYGPSISEPSKIVNRDVPACDEQAYKAAGYKRGSIPEVVEAEPAKLESPKSESADLSKMTKAQLVAEAERLGVTVVPDEMTKAQIVAAIEDAAEPVEDKQ